MTIDLKPARADFLSDIIITAINDGIEYWAEMGEYLWEDDMPVLATLRESDDGYESPWMNLDHAAVELGIGQVLGGNIDIRADLKNIVAEANITHDASEIDAGIADIIVQAALLGEIRYG